MNTRLTNSDGRVPVIQLYETLIVSLPESLSDSLLASVKNNVAHRLRSREGTLALVIEVSALEVFDSFVARIVRDLAQVSRLMGVQTVLAGLDHTMAITLVEMGLEMDGVHTVLSLQDAIELVCPWLKKARRGFEKERDEASTLASILGEAVAPTRDSAEPTRKATPVAR